MLDIQFVLSSIRNIFYSTPIESSPPTIHDVTPHL